MASNRNVLKRYAPQARLDFIQAVTNRAAQFGITKDGHEAGEVQGDLFILNGKAYPRSAANQRNRLIARIAREGFAQAMEAVAYTWFNRFLAIRYMEVHGYLDHGYRVLSNPNGHAEPEILEKATSVDLPGLNRDEIVNLKLDGTKDEQIYRKLLIAQCNDLHRAMPFLFEKIDDETELLLPENLLQSDSIVRKLVDEIAEDEWQEIEIIGWLYQFYISEKKDQVIGKVVKSEDIPAATQLFTPNWIVKYMVQNSLGAQWLATYPESGIRSNYPMEYYIAPAEQTPEVQAQIDAITPKALDPEAITLIDPAVGSGHILVEAYDLFRAIYLERGYTKREAARAILTNNLFGLDIDDRAAQMAGFALLMKACADDRTVLRNPPHLNVLALQDSDGLDAEALAKALLPQERFEIVPSGDLLPETLTQPTLSAQQPTSNEAKAIKALVTLFDGAKTFGSLITVPDSVMQSLPLLDALLAKPLPVDLYQRQTQEDAQEALKPLVEQARLLGGLYDCVIANPPYMGSKFHNSRLKEFLRKGFPHSFNDTYTSFIERCVMFCEEHGTISMVTLPSWLSLPTYGEFRTQQFSTVCLRNMNDNGRGVWGPDFGSCAFTLNKLNIANWVSRFQRLYLRRGEVSQNNEIEARFHNRTFIDVPLDRLKAIPNFPLAYWAGEETIEAFEKNLPLSAHHQTRNGMTTGDNDYHLRIWHEVSLERIAFYRDSSAEVPGKSPWVPYSKGGEFRKWYGNNYLIIKWGKNGSEFKKYSGSAIIRSESYYFRECVTWSLTSMLGFGARYRERGFIFDVNGMSMFSDDSSLYYSLAILNSSAGRSFLEIINPTIAFQSGDIASIPYAEGYPQLEELAKLAVELTKADWDESETSWAFNHNGLTDTGATTIDESYCQLQNKWLNRIAMMEKIENEIDLILLSAYKITDIEVPSRSPPTLTLNCNPHYRFSGNFNSDELEAKLKSDTMRELVSYAVGCMMGRYSLAEPGLIYADVGGVGFDPSRYGPFPADDDGIIPMTEEQWFSDDAATRIEEFLTVAWPEAPIMETMTTLMDSLTMGKAGEPRAALRSYLSKQFYKDHLQTYKNRPIYWLFSSGKQKAFEALVYLHRYNEGTLARMRTVYVTPLMGKLQQRISDLDAEIAASASSAEKTRKTREKDKLAKQVVELRAFDEELRHLADQRIALDLDDGVKVNYARFGNLLAAKDKVCPKKKGEDE